MILVHRNEKPAENKTEENLTNLTNFIKEYTPCLKKRPTFDLL